MNLKTTTLFIITATIALAAGLYLGNLSDNSEALKPPVIQGAIYPQAKQLKPFEVVNQDNEVIGKDNFRGHWSLVFVGYTHCPDICPTTMAVMNSVVGFMQEQNITPPTIVFLSIDPERDTPAIIKDYVSYFNPDFIGLTGSEEQVAQLTRQLSAVYKKAPGLSGQITEDDYLMDHSSALMLINPDGNLQSILTAPHLPGIIIESILSSQTYYDVIKNG